jgi:hypothetical protein
MEQLKKIDWAHIRRGGHRFEALIEIKRVKDISRDGAVD